ncbi:MAG: hypothetical protein ACWA42_03800 [Lutibacter sp.]
MKKIMILFFVVLIATNIKAQSPQKMSYQAVIRDASNALITNTTVGMQISILQTTTSGTAVYVETQAPTTNANGLVSVEVGGGTVVSGTFSAIDWSAGPYFIKTEIDPAGGTSYSISATSQLLSVPYALYAKTAESLTSTSNKHFVGELFGGGIVYYIYDDGQHGLIASLDDLDGGSGVAWSGNIHTLIGPSAQSFFDGASNTTAMVTLDSTPNKAGTLCDSYSYGGFSDWYLPSSWELNLLYNSAYVISNILANDGNGSTNPLHADFVSPTYGKYWSSTEYDGDNARLFIFGDGSSAITGKLNSNYRVRAIRSF